MQMDSVMCDVAPDLLIPVQKHISGFSKTHKKNLKRAAKKRSKMEEIWGQRVLPVTKQADRIIEAVRDNRVTVIVAETGCGKSSQVPQILLREGLAGEDSIVCTQPRRVAAWTLASRVAKEMECELGGKVGFHVRFERCTSPSTRITFMTDGILLQQYLYDNRQVGKYGVVIIDEVHERSLQLDLLLGVIKKEMARRNDLKLVIMSATMNTKIFSDFFDEAPVVEISGSHHPVQVKYDPGYTLDHVLDVIAKIIERNEPGDMLVFLPGRADIDAIADALGTRKRRSRSRRMLVPPSSLRRSKLFVLEAHAELPSCEMDRIFERAPQNHWKIILATNVAESSLTVEGLRFVVDSGFVNVKVFDGKTGVHTLVTRLISRSEAEQRKGRVGRTQPGECYRLYSKRQLAVEEEKKEKKEEEEEDDDESEDEDSEEEEEDKENMNPMEERKERKTCEEEQYIDYGDHDKAIIEDPVTEKFRAFPQPMIELEDLSQFFLIMKRSGFSTCGDFPFISPPNKENMAAAEKDLARLGAINLVGGLTKFGRHMTTFPVHPRLAAALLKAATRGCGYGMLLLVSMLSAFSGGRRNALMSLTQAGLGYDEAVDEIEVLMMILDDFKEIEEAPWLTEWFWEKYQIKASYFFEASSTYKQLKILLERYCGWFYTPDSPEASSFPPEEAFYMFEVRGVLREVFAPHIGYNYGCSRNRKGVRLPSGTRAIVDPKLIMPYPRDTRLSGIDLFSVRDIRSTKAQPMVYLSPSFKLQPMDSDSLLRSCFLKYSANLNSFY